ncbi:leukemia inhibitory factor receptor [Anoplopoma fimbria]|uniref:leukemia inhibitory factor receptor n=1 Tax=Anoplopoma fimbria TaxID=229290 RepID=UPI0023EC7DBA|nr:leukemia inhibitory factor receptor [Anoplopoma fimbria]
MDHRGGCWDTVLQPPSLSISHDSDRQSLLVSWWVNHSSLVGDVYEIQISRSEIHTVIYNKSLSLSSVDSDEYQWTWTSDVPLECVDHSVRMRQFYNWSVPSPWTDWVTHYGAQAQDKTTIFPSMRVLRENTRAVFCCVPPKGVSITSMTYNNTKYPLLSIGVAGVKAITVPNLTIPTALIKRLTLSCSDARGKTYWAWNNISFPPQKPGNLRCATSDMITIICTWDSGRERDPHDPNKQTHILYIENSDQAPISCKSSSCTFPAVPQREEYNISVVVKDQLGEETESYSFNISDRVFPVMGAVMVSPGVTHATVSWVVQGNLSRLNLLCQVTTDPYSSTQLSCNSASGLCEVELDHLLPNTRYSTRVRCSASGRLWGEWTHPVSFTTYQMVTLDVWRRIKQLSDPNTRQVTLLWTPLVPSSADTVNIQGYIVQWSQGGQNWTESKDSGQTQAEVSIDAGRHDFTVQAVVLSGSTIPAHITVPERDDGEIPPAKKRLSSNTAAGFNLSWDNADIVTCGYTVEWCILGNAVPCTDALRWMKVPEGNNALVLPARQFKAGCRYTFDIYGCTENGHRLLEVQTGYSQELQSVKSPSLVEPVQSTSSSVTLKWSYNEDDPAHPAFITGYQVTAQEVGSDHFNVSVVDPHIKSVTIEGLQQNHEYTFSVSTLTKDGPGLSTNITIRTRTNLDSAQLAKILTPILLLLGCIILMWPQRKMLKDIFAYPDGMNIKTPELEGFLHETAKQLQSQKVEECSSCVIEILTTRPPLAVTTALTHPEPLPGSQSSPSLSCVPLQADYCPQSVTVLWDGPALQPIACIKIKTYLRTMDEDLPEAQVMFTGIHSSFEPSESQQESCSVMYAYISNDGCNIPNQTQNC